MLKTKQKEEKLDLPGFASWFCCKASAELKAQLLHQARKTIYGHWPLSLLSDIAIVIILLQEANTLNGQLHSC